MPERTFSSEPTSSAKQHSQRVIPRDAKSGGFVSARSANKAARTTTVRPSHSPDTFLEEFTSHPVVDRVMKRLSR